MESQQRYDPKACCVGISPLARHHTLEETAAIVKLAAKDVY